MKKTVVKAMVHKNNSMLKGVLMLSVVAVNFLLQRLLLDIPNDFYYYAAGGVKCLFVSLLCFLVLAYLAKRRKSSILLLIYMGVNVVTYLLNLLLLDLNTYTEGVEFSQYYQLVKGVRWESFYSISFVYSTIEYLIIIQGLLGIGIFCIRAIGYRVLSNHRDFSSSNRNSDPLHPLF